MKMRVMAVFVAFHLTAVSGHPPVLSAHSEESGEQHRDTVANEPGPAQKALAALAGDYSTVIKFRGSPSAQPVQTTGSAKLASILEGRFITEENSGTQFGEPFAGFRLTGYNNAIKQYETSWTYTGSTAILNMTGESNDNGRTIDWNGSFVDTSGDKIPIHARTKIAGPGTFTVEMTAKTQDQTEFVVLETTYTRKK
jgi:hypothetical protein